MRYEDIINLPHHVSEDRSQMSLHDRAAQFSPFAALTGFDSVIDEAGRLTDGRIELDDASREEMDRVLTEILSVMEQGGESPSVYLSFFKEDLRKEGGAYLHVSGTISKIDLYRRCLVMSEGQVIPLEDIFQLSVLEKR